MAAIFVLLVLMGGGFLLVGIRDICTWYSNRSRQRKDETKQWQNFHNKFEERP